MNDSEPLNQAPGTTPNSIGGEVPATSRGRLKIFFGMCPGVGKSYAMLEAAHKAKREGINVVIGIIETHKRPELNELAAGLERIPLKEISYRNSSFKELDLDAVIKRRPALVIVDEMAHTNIPGSRHSKRYDDILELLNYKIDVYTTLNLHDLESRAETVGQITGMTVKETVPDLIFDDADDIELIDITIDTLLTRLAEGKVYTAEKSSKVIRNSIRRGNLSALREMALRILAERVNKNPLNQKMEKKIDATWKSAQKLMVAIGPSPHSANLIRWTRRFADSLEAPWIVVHVDTNQELSVHDKSVLENNFNLARELGAEIITTQDTNLISALLRVAKESNISQLIIGKSRDLRPSKYFFQRNFIRKLLKRSGEIDVYIVGGDESKIKSLFKARFVRLQSPLYKYLISSAIILLQTLILYSVSGSIGYQTVSLIFLFTISILPLFNLGPGPVLLAALISAFSWDYFFIPPHFTLYIGKVEDLLMFIMYFIIAIVSGLLSAEIRTQQAFLRQKELRTSSLYNLSKEFSSADSIDDIAEIAVTHIQKTFGSEVVLLLNESPGKLNAQPHSASSLTISDLEWHIAQWVYLNSRKAGKFTDTLSSSQFTFYPLKSKLGSIGVIGIKTGNARQFSFDQETLFETFITQISNAVEREYLNNVAKQSMLITESEKLYKTLFNSISHELKTPITTIIGAVSSLNDEGIVHNRSLFDKLLREINIAAGRLNRLVENLLDMARLESGNLRPKFDWHLISDLVNSVLQRFHSPSQDRSITSVMGEDVPPFKFDHGLLEQALVNIIHNSIEYTPIGSKIEIDVRQIDKDCIIKIADNGPGIPEETLGKLFNKFYRIPGTKAGGTGLGLSIAKGFIEAHNGKITASNKKSGGAVFTITLPMRREN